MSRQGGEGLRIFRNSAANYQAGLDLEHLDEHYPDVWFENLRAHGFNAFWICARLRQLIAFRQAPTAEQAGKQDALRRLTERAARFDVRLYMMLNEPRALEVGHLLFEQYPELAGAREMWPYPEKHDVRMICTSAEVGKAYVYENAKQLFTLLPGLGGTIHLTASEGPTHCYCHVIANPGGTIFASNMEHEGIDCPRCAERAPEQVISEILNLFHSGARDAGSQADVIAWNWDWVMYRADPQPDLVRALHPEINVMASFECGGSKTIYGQDRRVEEYSLISVGPSRQFTEIADFAMQTGHAATAKIQVGTTHEAGTAANMPLLGHLFGKLEALRDAGIDDVLCTWALGTRLTLNTAAVGLARKQPELDDRDSFLDALCRTYLGREGVAGFRRAIALIEEAFDSYPIANRMCHVGPVSFALTCPLDGAPLTGKALVPNWRAVPVEEIGDDWDECLGPYTWDEVIPGLETMLRLLQQGITTLEAVLFPSGPPSQNGLGAYAGEPAILRMADQLSDEDKVARLREVLPGDVFERIPELAGIHGYRCLEEWTNAWTLYATFESMLRLFRNFLGKREGRPDYPAWLKTLQCEELGLLRFVHPLFCLDERLGLHLECQSYLVNRERIECKIKTLEHALSRGVAPA